MTLQRRTPLKRKRSTPRLVRTPEALQCHIGGCSALATVLLWCRKHAKERADRMFSDLIRTRDEWTCQVCGRQPSGVGLDRLECMHGESRSKHATRWSEDNAWAGCHGCHFGFTMHPARWELWRRERIGDEAFDAIRLRAERGGMPDLGWLIGELRTRLNELGVAA